ncbi:hypothetical protein ACHAXS_010278 [Conticribra weissflogii]
MKKHLFSLTAIGSAFLSSPGANSFSLTKVPGSKPTTSVPTLRDRHSATSLSSTPDLASSAPETSADSPSSASKFWKWRNHDIFTEVRLPLQNDDDKPAAILLHGFGASTTYWRETAKTLQSEGYEVHALDLLGQGRSSKPVPAETGTDDTDSEKTASSSLPMEMGVNTNEKVEYSINLWANLVDDYAREHGIGSDDRGVVLMGNSLGSLVALAAATGDFVGTIPIEAEKSCYLAGTRVSDSSSSLVRGLCLFNCAVGLNSRNLLKNPMYNSFQRAVLNWLFDLLDFLVFDNKLLLTYALNDVVTKDVLRDALTSLYTHDPERVDDELVDSFYYPAKLGGSGAVEAIRQIYTNDAGLTPMEMHQKHSEVLDAMPLHLIWGEDDVVTPITGDVGRFYCDRVANNRGGRGMTTIDVVSGGHILFDDNPIEVNAAMLKWLDRKVLKK